MVIAVVTVWVMQVAIDKVVDVVAMRNWLVSASRTMDVAWFVSTTVMMRCTFIRIVWSHVNSVFFNYTIIALSMQVAIVKIVRMIPVRDPGMPAPRTVDMGMIVMRMFGHQKLQFIRFSNVRNWSSLIADRKRYTNS
jgi:hypothetical protein